MTDFPEMIDLFNPEFVRAYELLRATAANVFLTGKAGTGKSTFLRYICKHIKKKHVVLAPTGVAAVNVGGVTIHSFFQMPLRPVPPDDPDYSVASLRKSRKFSRQKRKLMQELDLIIIDEVSMVRPDMIDFIDRALRGVRGKRGIPFGGVQLLLVGDIFQLEPVVTPDTRRILAKYYTDFFFFNAHAYNHVNLISVELKKIYRQSDSMFIGLLDRIRLNCATYSDFEFLNSRVISQDSSPEDDSMMKFGVTLTTRRDVASMINKERMDAIVHPEIVFEGEIEGDFPDKILPTELSLVLKKEAQVMLIRNDKDRRWVNGTLARIQDISPEGITIELEDGRVEKVEKEIWYNINYFYDEKENKVKEDVVGQFTQYPLKAAWALTIHKCQGLTFNNVTIDMTGGAFSAGQTYVALSRCRSIEGLRLVSPVRRWDVIVNKVAVDYSKNFNDLEVSEKVLKETEAVVLTKDAIMAFDNGDYREAVECVWQVNSLVGALDRKSVRRLLSMYIGKIKTLKEQLAIQSQKIRKLSKEFAELGNMCMEEGADIEGSYGNYVKALDLDPSNMDALFGLTRCQYESGDVKDAIKNIDALLKRKGGKCFEALLLKGDIQVAGECYSEAILSYMAAHKIRKRDRVPIERIISLYEKLGQDDMADGYRDLLNDDGQLNL